MYCQVKIRYTAVQQNGSEKEITETYLFSAVSFADAETKAAEYAHSMNFRDYAVTAVSKVKLADFIPDDDDNNGPIKWYRAKLKHITINERTAKEESCTSLVLIAAESFDAAASAAKNYVSQLISDTQILSIAETNIIDVISE